jgi:hypothetical protein
MTSVRSLVKVMSDEHFLMLSRGMAGKGGTLVEACIGGIIL